MNLDPPPSGEIRPACLQVGECEPRPPHPGAEITSNPQPQAVIQAANSDSPPSGKPRPPNLQTGDCKLRPPQPPADRQLRATSVDSPPNCELRPTTSIQTSICKLRPPQSRQPIVTKHLGKPPSNLQIPPNNSHPASSQPTQPNINTEPQSNNYRLRPSANQQIQPSTKVAPSPHLRTASHNQIVSFDPPPSCKLRSLQTDACKSQPPQPRQLSDVEHSGKQPPNPSVAKIMFCHFCKRNPLSNQSNPRNAWGKHAPRRAPAFIAKVFGSHTKHLLKLLESQLFKTLNTLKTKLQVYHIIEHSTYLYLHLTPGSMAGASKTNTRHHNPTPTPEVVMEEVTPPSKRTSPHSSKQPTRNPRATRYPSTEIHLKSKFGMNIRL